MTFIHEFNLFFISILPTDSWNVIEIFGGIGIFFACIIQRSKQNIFSSNAKNLGAYTVKVGQLGLFFQMMLGILTTVDGYENYIDGKSHVILAMWVMSSSLVKYSVYLNIFNIFVPKNNEIE
jgi:hypothetical protein